MSKSSPRRLLDGGGSSIGRSLVRAGRAQRPSRQRSAAAIAAALASIEGSAEAGQPRAGGAAPSGSCAPPSGVMPLAGKVVLALGVAGALALGASYRLGDREPAPTATAPAAAAAQPSAPLPSAPPAETAALADTEATVSVEDLPRAPSRLARTNAAPAPAAASPAAADRAAADSAATTPTAAADSSAAKVSLEPELDALQTARSHLRAGDPRGALNELAHYDARFPRGKLRAEALELGVEAEMMAGHGQAARERADAFLNEYGDSPLAPRVRTLRDRLEAP